MFNLIQRKRHARGFGIHSPFAFNFITRVVYEKNPYYAFIDLAQLIKKYHAEKVSHAHLSFRLVMFFKPTNIIELNSGLGINLLYIHRAAPNSRISSLTKIDLKTKEEEKLFKLIQQKGINVLQRWEHSVKYDALFLHPPYHINDVEAWFSQTAENAFWLITGINSSVGKQCWRKIVDDKRATLTFDMKVMGIVVFKREMFKSHYLI